MLPELLATSGARSSQRFLVRAETAGTLAMHPAFAELFERLNLRSAKAFLDLPGEVVSGHPDRHVVRVEFPGTTRAFYLKRQHVVGWRERLRNRVAGFGSVSRCEREAILLQQLSDAELPAPQWAAFGSMASQAFLLVEEVPEAIELRQLLSDNRLSYEERLRLAETLGRAVAAVHAAGFTTPDLTAKHILVNPHTLAVTFLDWQTAARGVVSDSARTETLGALHASLAHALAAPRERRRAFQSYAHSAISKEDVFHAAARHANRRSVRDQLQPATGNAQRLVWLAGEAVCAIPEIASEWPRPVVAPPFYDCVPGVSFLRFANRDAILIRGRTAAPLGHLRAWLHATPWRSPGVTMGRVLFHLERYGVPAPRLFAFGQRSTNRAESEWFALYEEPPGVLLRRWQRTAPPELRRALVPSLTACVRRLHDAGCVLTDVGLALAVHGGRVLVADPRAVQIVRRVTDSARRRDLRAATRLLDGK